MNEHPELYWILGGVGMLVGGLVIKIIWDWLKNNQPESENRASKRTCPLDRGKVIKTMEHADETMDVVSKKLDKIDSDLTIGVDVVRRNTKHYEEFVKTLAGLDNGIKQMISEMKLQTTILLSIRTNGNGKK